MTSTRKIALITGGSRGLGRNTALHLADKGVDSVITYKSSADKAEAVAADIRARGGKSATLQLDTCETSAFPAFVADLKEVLQATWGRDTIDFLVNNAGTGINTPIAETTEEQFDDLMNMHVKGVFFLTQQLLPVITDGGHILNISSGLARFTLPGYGAYATMKGAVEVLTRYLAKELGPRKIAVNTFAPGAIETDFGGGLVRDNAEVNKLVAGMTAMGRVGQPDDIGGAISTLLAGDMGWMTGQRIEVSGGMNL